MIEDDTFQGDYKQYFTSGTGNYDIPTGDPRFAFVHNSNKDSCTYVTSVIKLNVKRLSEHAVIPTKSYGDAGWDLYYSGETIEIQPQTRVTLNTGLAIEIPYGYVGLIWPRSGLAVKHGIDILAGVIDSTYRGEIKVCLLNTNMKNTFQTSSEDKHVRKSLGFIEINKGDRIAQILFQQVPDFELVEVDKLDNTTQRGEGGFGSTGK